MTENYTLPSALAAVLDASPDIQFVLSADQTILFANAAFRAANPDEAGPLIGQSLADGLMGRDAGRAASRRTILDAVRQALATGDVIQPAPFRYDVQKDFDRPPREAWWRLFAAPCILGDRPCLLVTASEVTEAIFAGREAPAIKTSKTDRTESLLWAERRRLSQMFDQATDMMSLVVGPDHVFELVNPAMKRAASGAQLLGRSMRDLAQSEETQEIVRRLDEVRATGRPFTAQAQPFCVASATHEDRFIDVTLQPLTDETGRVEAIFYRGRDVTEQVHALAAHRFLREELAHRQGNNLAVVLAIAEQSAAKAGSFDRFRAVFAGRLSALAAVNCLLNRHGPNVSVAEIFHVIAHPIAKLGRISGGGAATTLTPKAAITLGLMFHEILQLCHIESKQGSTRPRIRAHRRAGLLHLIWTSDLCDFGSYGDDFPRRLIDHSVRHEFDGRWVLFRRKKGAALCFEFPLSHSAWARSGAVA